MAGIYEALVRADQERNATAESPPSLQRDDSAHDLAAVGALLHRLEDRVETELADNYDERFEHFASIEVSLGALEDRLEDRERDQKAASADLEALVARLVAEVGTLTDRIDYELPLLRSELIQAIEGRMDPIPTNSVGARRPRSDSTGLARMFGRFGRSARKGPTRA